MLSLILAAQTYEAWGILLAVLVAAVLFVRYLRLCWPTFDRIAAAALEDVDAVPTPPRTSYSWRWCALGLLLVAVSLGELEHRQPCYFTQDDALVAELPGMLEGCRSVWQGIWPEYDPCRCMGGPLASDGMFSLTYPPTYLSYAIARHVLGNEDWALEVFAFLHLIAGYFATYALCRACGMRPSLACCGAVAFVLSGSFLIMGRGWHTFIPLALWLPLLTLGMVHVRENNVGWPWIAKMGICGGMLFHVGFPQLWFYAGAALAMVTIVWTLVGVLSPRRIIAAVTAATISIGIAMPLLLAQLVLSRQMEPLPLETEGLTKQWIGALLPYPFFKGAAPQNWGSLDTQYMGHLAYFGGTFALLFLAAIVVLFSKPTRKGMASNIWLVLAAIGAVYSTGDAGPFDWLIRQLPLAGLSAQHPFRILPLVVLFAIIGGGVFTERLARTVGPRGRRPIALLVTLTLLLIGYHVAMSRTAFYLYGFKPYPPLAPVVKEHVKSGDARYASWTQFRSISPELAATVPLDLSMQYRLCALGGYDPFIEGRPIYLEMERKLQAKPAEAVRAYGVKWHLISPLLSHFIYSPNEAARDIESKVIFRKTLNAISPSLKLVGRSPGVRLYEMPDVAPMAFASNNHLPLPLTVACDGLSADLRQRPPTQPDFVTINFLWWPQMIALCDEQPARCTADDWGRTVVEVPIGTKRVQVVFNANWERGIIAGAAVILLAVFFQTASHRFIHA